MNIIDKIFKNRITCCYVFFAIFIELLGITFTDCFPYITEPWYALILLALATTILLVIKNNLLRLILSSLFLGSQIIMIIGFTYLYDSNGTYFDWSMFNQKNDAFGTIEDLTLNWNMICIYSLIFLVFIVIGIFAVYSLKKIRLQNTVHQKLHRAGMSIFMTFSILLTICMPVINGINESNSSYIDKLYNSNYSVYQRLGITSNAIYEFISGQLATSVDISDVNALSETLLIGDNTLDTSDYFGVSEGNNLVMVLVESFDWYPLTLYDEETTALLYPNIVKFMSDSIVCDNFYSREKTDTAEMLMLLGSNPSDKYINYDFPLNEYPYSLPNLFSSSVESNGNELLQIKSFHQNDGDFYNRNVLHESLGFEELVDINDMAEFGLQNTWDENDWGQGERTLDSKTIEAMKDSMFLSTKEDEQFFTFYISLVMHGYYEERESFKEEGYYDYFDELNVFPKGLSTKGDYLRTYAAAVMDFDKALGIMMTDLEEKGCLDNTTILLIADHNTYYNNLAYYAKNITEQYNSELYRVPLMIYDTKLKEAMIENGDSLTVNKFTTTADIVPTVLDIFGIKGWDSLYLGKTIFIDSESIIYSRAYGIFVTDKLICYSANELLYQCENFDEIDLASFVERAEKHLSKLEFIDKILYSDYFATHEYTSPT